jgi:hypothetical protein
VPYRRQVETKCKLQPLFLRLLRHLFGWDYKKQAFVFDGLFGKMSSLLLKLFFETKFVE